MTRFDKIYLYGGGDKQWDTLIHNGPMMAPLYQPHHIPIIINNQQHQLSSIAEEYITLYAKYIDTEYVKNPKISKRFNKNFLHDWRKVLPNNIAKSFSDMSQLMLLILKNI